MEREEYMLEDEKYTFDVVCAGQALIDCIVRGKEEDACRKHVYRAESIALNIGGDAINEAIVLSHLGRRVKAVFGVGEDLAGQLVRDTAERYNVDISGTTMDPGLVTPIANLHVALDGSRYSLNSEATKLEGYRVDPGLLSGARVVSLASLFRAPLDQAEDILRLVKQAKEQKSIVCADTKLPTYQKLGLDDIREILPMVDYIFPNADEAAFFTGKRDLYSMARVFFDYGVRHVVIKNGAQGCAIFDENGYFNFPAKAVKAVDTTGAGDNFAAGFIHGILDGCSFKECCEIGIETAAESVKYMGAIGWLK